MALKSIADEAVVQIGETLLATMSNNERASVSRIVEQAVIDAATSASENCVKVVKFHTGHEADLAHKIAEELQLAETALIANLMGMR